MSVLALPRLVFQGTTSWNPNTVNNSTATYEEDSATPHFNPPLVTASNYDIWLKTYDPSRQDLPGSWNIYGDQGCSFVNAMVTGIQLASGPSGTDPLLGQAVQMAGQPFSPSSTPPPCRMVDVDPFSPYTTQIFYQTIVIGDATVGVTGPGVVRMFSRWPNLSRNLGAPAGIGHAGQMGVEWQATVAADQLTWSGVDQSPALASLQKAVGQGQGLVLRFASYGTVYLTQATWNGQPITTLQQLSEAYLGGFQGANPAVSAALGTIGVWGPGELASAPTERVLLPGAGLTPSIGSTKFRAAVQIRSSRDVAVAGAPPTVSAVQLGTAFARVDSSRNVVTLDFLGTFPEQDASLTKADFGTFELQAVPSGGGPPATIGPPLTYDQYAQSAYETGGGIVDFAFAADQANLVETGLLQLVQTGTANLVALQETALLAETDQRGVYVDQEQTQQITIQVYQQGATPPAESVEILLALYDEGLNNVDSGASILELLDAEGNPLPDPPVLSVGSDGTATFGVSPRQSGIASIFFLPYVAGSVQPTLPDLGNPQIPDSYAVVRALPFDNRLLQVPPTLLTWDFIYSEVLQSFNLVYPLMSLILNLGDEKTVNQNAKAIEARTSLELFLTTNFMPITREMSAGKRYVLQQYLSNLPQGGGSTR